MRKDDEREENKGWSHAFILFCNAFFLIASPLATSSLSFTSSNEHIFHVSTHISFHKYIHEGLTKHAHTHECHARLSKSEIKKVLFLHISIFTSTSQMSVFTFDLQKESNHSTGTCPARGYQITCHIFKPETDTEIVHVWSTCCQEKLTDDILSTENATDVKQQKKRIHS